MGPALRAPASLMVACGAAGELVEGEIALSKPQCSLFVVHTTDGFSLLNQQDYFGVYEGDHVRGLLHRPGLHAIEAIGEMTFDATVGELGHGPGGGNWACSIPAAKRVLWSFMSETDGALRSRGLTKCDHASPGVSDRSTAPPRGVSLPVDLMDIAARLVAPWLSARLRQPVIVENHPGESGNLATRMVVRAPPDGSTVLLCGPVNTINTTLFADLDFDFTRDIAPVASISRVPLVIEVNPAVRAKKFPEFIALAKDRPGQIVEVAYAGRGTPQHVGIKLFEMMAGVELTLVPYLGSEPALADLLGGQVQAMFDPMPSSLPHLRAGSLIPLAVTSPSRSEVLSDVPSASECLPDATRPDRGLDSVSQGARRTASF